MGREIRRVPPNWEHPKHHEQWRAERGELQPMFDDEYEPAKRQWLDGLAQWEAKTHPDYDPKYEFWEWEGQPPDKKYFRPWNGEEATWYQVWETVSEGTPVSPPFATKEELIQYLAEHGDFWDQHRGAKPWGYAAAKRFVDNEWAPSLVVNSAGVQEGKLAFTSQDDIPTEEIKP